MKKTILIALAALLTGSAAFAQEEKPAHFKLYGFIRNYVAADTRAVKYEEGKLKAEFRRTDNIYVIKNGSLDSNALHPDQDGTTANLVGKLNGTYAANDELTLLYNTKDDGTFSFAKQIGGHIENKGAGQLRLCHSKGEGH